MSFKVGDEVLVADCGFLSKGVIEAFLLHPRYKNVVVIKSKSLGCTTDYYNIYKPFAYVTDKDVYVNFTVCNYEINGNTTLENLLESLELQLEKMHKEEKLY